MKNFWPHRTKAKGFSIGNFARKYRERISSVSSCNPSNQFLNDRNLESINEDSKQIAIDHLSNRKGHWANRDFSEYREVA